MSVCGCCGGCGCQACNYIVNLPDNPVEQYSAVNINVGGVGAYDSTSGGTQFNFRGVGSANAMLSVSLDAPNALILLTVSASAIAAALPSATTTQAGVLETATDAEAIAKTATDKIVTPSNFAAMASTTTFAGLAEIATQAEVTAGVASTVFVAPDTLAVLLATKKYTTTFADAVARAALAPTFDGQFGSQIDTNQGFVANGVGAGSWLPLFTFGTSQTITAATTVTLTGVALDFSGTGTINYANDTVNYNGSVVNYTGTAVNSQTTWTHEGDWNFVNGNLDLDTFTLTISGGAAPSSVVVTDPGGEIYAKQIDEFISDANVQTGWTVTNPSVSRTLDVSAATLAEVRAVLGSLINDLKAIKLPST